MIREKRARNTVRVDIKKPDDIYKLQEALIDKGDDSTIRAAAEELASNMVEFNETGYIIANCEKVHCFIEKSSLDKNSEVYLKLAYYMDQEFYEKKMYDKPIRVHKDFKDLGGFGLKRMRFHGWKYKLKETKNYFVIVAEMGEENGKFY